MASCFCAVPRPNGLLATQNIHKQLQKTHYPDLNWIPSMVSGRRVVQMFMESRYKKSQQL